MAQAYDVIVAGLGAMGSATAYHLSLAGLRVLGLDRFHPPHDRGSSHGRTRIIREAYFEHPLYVPLVQRAYDLWAKLEAAAGRRLFLQTGGLMIGPPDGVIVRGALLSASAIQSHLELAAKQGATLRFDESVTKWEPLGDGVRVTTPQGAYEARRLLLSSGAWLAGLVPELNLRLAVERQAQFWFDPGTGEDRFDPGHCPIHIWEYAPHRFFYGFPNLGEGVKVAFHHEGEHSDPDHVRRDVSSQEIETMRNLLHRFMPQAGGPLKSTAVCLYTNTPDEHFLLDYHPSHRQVLIASPCSGHGFKFSPVIGELAAGMLQDQSPHFDLGLFQIGRVATRS
jgi:sarcosine oxidase